MALLENLQHWQTVSHIGTVFTLWMGYVYYSIMDIWTLIGAFPLWQRMEKIVDLIFMKSPFVQESTFSSPELSGFQAITGMPK